MSIFSGVTASTKLGGIFGLSCYLLLHKKLKDFVPSDSPNKDTPIFMGHGDRDPIVSPQKGQKSAEVLKEGGWKVDLKMYRYVVTDVWFFLSLADHQRGLEHSALPEEIDDVENYLNSRIPALGDKSGL